MCLKADPSLPAVDGAELRRRHVAGGPSCILFKGHATDGLKKVLDLSLCFCINQINVVFRHASRFIILPNSTYEFSLMNISLDLNSERFAVA